jgi:hypothetical protein
MQLSASDAAALRQALGAASAALLAPGLASAQTTPAATPAPAPTATPTWQVDSAVLFYVEGGGRVRAVEPVTSARRTDGNDVSYGLKLTLDSLTGASPNGAVAQPTAQTFTSPSGKSTYTTAAGRTPLDPSFKDTRVALSGSMERPFGAQQRLSLGANVSSEYDFVSASVSGGLSRDFNQKNTTVSLSLALEADQIKPVGGTPLGLRPTTSTSARTGNETRHVFDLLLGVTQVVNRNWVTQLNLGYGRGTGYHSDPYKLLSVVDSSTGLLTGDRYVNEQRPDSRSRFSLYWQHKVHLTHDVVDVGYRFYRDDWGVTAHTLDTRYRWELGGGLYVEPRWRVHRQSAADFSRTWLEEGRDWHSTSHSSTLQYASADSRLAAFTAHTVGLKFGMPLRGGELTARVDAYRQQPGKPGAAPGVLQTLELVPALKASTVVLGYSFAF